MRDTAAAEVLSVFASEGGGGNPVLVVLDADGWSDREMQDAAREVGFESVFVLGASRGRATLRFWAPAQEMSMCGHATIGAALLLRDRAQGADGSAFRFDTAAGPVRAGSDDVGGWYEQRSGRVEAVSDESDAAAALGLARDLLAGPVENGAAPRAKTLIPLRDRTTLDGLRPSAAAVRRACEELDSTGLYPYVLEAPGIVHARQFPAGSGYREDPATGVAAAALFFALRGRGALAGEELIVEQGAAMGRPSRIRVTSSPAEDAGCRVSGEVVRRYEPISARRAV